MSWRKFRERYSCPPGRPQEELPTYSKDQSPTVEKELRSKLEIRLRPGPFLKLNCSKLMSLVLCLLHKW